MSVKIDKKTVENSIKNIINNAGYILFDVEINKSADKVILNIIIDKKDGVDIEDCETVTRLIDPILDTTEGVGGEYDYLTVSSAGIDRPFLTTEDFESHLGEKIEVKLYSSVNGKKFIQLPLVEVDEDTITLIDKKNKIKINRTNIVKANIAIEF